MTPTSQWGFVMESKAMGFAAAQGRHVAGAHQVFVRMCYPCSMSALAGPDVDLLQKMLQYEPARRIPAKKALEHPYFNAVRKEMH